MGGAGFVILFVISFTGLAIWSMIYLTFASHYFLTIVVDSSAGNDEIEFSSGVGVIDWWWKPLFCLWVLGAWIVPLALLLLPLLGHSSEAYLLCWVGLVWILYPISMLSVLYTQNWIFLLHPVMLLRMLQHFLAFGYVHLLTLISCGSCVVLLVLATTHSFLWAGLAAFAIPTAILFYARHWGRFAWLSLNFLPRRPKPTNPYMELPMPTPKPPLEEDAPEVDAQEAGPASEGVRAGLPPAYPGAIQASQTGIAAGAAPAPVPQDEWAMDNRPYVVEEDATQPTIHESPSPPPVPAAAPLAPPPPIVEEVEDEWSLDKKPYDLTDAAPPVEPADSVASAWAADKPVPVSQIYDEMNRKEREKKRKAEAQASRLGMPKQSKKTPTFQTALLTGVWPFMIYGRTLKVWANLVVLTIVELFFLMMVVRFWPKLD